MNVHVTLINKQRVLFPANDVIFGICLSQDNYLIFMNSGCALTRWREQRQNPKLIHLPSAISCWPEAAKPCEYCMHKMAIWERPYWQKSMVNDNNERKFVVESCKTWIFICLSPKVQRVTTNLVKLPISCVFIINSNFYYSCFLTLAHKSMHQAEANEEPLRNSYPLAITCRPWTTNPRDHHMHIMVTWERPQTNRDRNLHHWKQICCVKLKLNCYPWLGIFWICCLTLIHQSPSGR